MTVADTINSISCVDQKEDGLISSVTYCLHISAKLGVDEGTSLSTRWKNFEQSKSNMQRH